MRLWDTVLQDLFTPVLRREFPHARVLKGPNQSSNNSHIVCHEHVIISIWISHGQLMAGMMSGHYWPLQRSLFDEQQNWRWFGTSQLHLHCKRLELWDLFCRRLKASVWKWHLTQFKFQNMKPLINTTYKTTVTCAMSQICVFVCIT